jgi:hypothetical protein
VHARCVEFTLKTLLSQSDDVHLLIRRSDGISQNLKMEEMALQRKERTLEM